MQQQYASIINRIIRFLLITILTIDKDKIIEIQHFVTTLLILAALFGYINERFVKLPLPVALMSFSLIFSLILILLERTGFASIEIVRSSLQQFDFSTFLLHGILSFLLFAGAIRANIKDLLSQKRIILLLATLGVVISTLIIGLLTYWLLQLLGFDLSFIYCFLFGALISPTDPVAVISLLKTMDLPISVHIKIMGEALFNDGVAVVIFLVLFSSYLSNSELSLTTFPALLFQEIIGGIMFGLLSGCLASILINQVNNIHVIIFITLAIVGSCYSFADIWQVSGPIAVVTAGLYIGNRLNITEALHSQLDTFWEMLDELLNALLFILIGLEILVMIFKWDYFIAGLLIIPIILLARFLSVGIPILLLKPFRDFSANVITLLTWGGIRGGISVAMALSLPPSSQRDLIVAITYIIVIFSVVVQGLTLNKVGSPTI